MASVNKVIVVGNLGQDPEVRYMPSGDAVANFSVATTDTWKDKEGNKQESTEWHRCSAFGRTAEVCGEYLKKGSPVYVEGKLQTRKWTDKEGIERYTTEVRVERMQMLGKPSGGQAGEDNAQRQTAPARAAQDQRPQAAARPQPAMAGGGGFADEDIPFAAPRGLILHAM